ncbi:hypothetical protein VTO42DRAFT_3562 [Malbranchea cinnamomea]
MSAPASLTGSNASFASDEDESKYLKRTLWLHWARIGLAGLLQVIALIAIACEAHPLHYYHQTRQYEDMWLFLWPQHLEVRPSVAFIVCNTLVFVAATVYVVVALLPSPRSRIIVLNYLASAVSLISLACSCVAIGIHMVFENPREYNGVILGETIHSWTCTWSFSHVHEYTDRDEPPEHIEGVKDFGPLCQETRVALGMTSTLIALDFFFCVSAAIGWWLEKVMIQKRSAAVAESFRSGNVSIGEKSLGE